MEKELGEKAVFIECQENELYNEYKLITIR